MRPIQLHLPSLAVGLAACALVFVCMSQALPGSNSPRIEYGPNARDLIQIKEGTPYTVPANHIFELTALGIASIQSGSCMLQVDGITEVYEYNTVGTQNSSAMAPVPRGFTVTSGHMITVMSGSQTGIARAWGYLAK